MKTNVLNILIILYIYKKHKNNEFIFTKNVAKLVQNPKLEKKLPTVLSIEEVDNLLNCLNAQHKYSIVADPSLFEEKKKYIINNII